MTKFTLKIHNGVESQRPDLLDMQDEVLLHLNKAGINAPVPQQTIVSNDDDDQEDDIQVMGEVGSSASSSSSDGGVQYLGLYEGLITLPVRGDSSENDTVNGGNTCPLAIRLLSWVEGDIMGNCQFDDRLIHTAGQYLGKISKSLSSFKHPSAKRVHAWDVKRSLGLRDFLHCLEPDMKALVTEVLNKFEEQVVPVSKMLPSSVIMGDFNDANIIVGETEDDYEVVGMIDVGDMVHTWRINEVAIGAAYALLTDYGKANHKKAAAELLKGYNKVFSLDMLELTLFKTLVACRLACSYTMGMYSYSQDPSNEYLLKHAAPAGEMLQKWWRESP